MAGLEFEKIETDEFVAPAVFEYPDPKTGKARVDTFAFVFEEVSEEEVAEFQKALDDAQEFEDELERSYGRNYSLDQLTEQEYQKKKAQKKIQKWLLDYPVEKLRGWRNITIPKPDGGGRMEMPYTEENRNRVINRPGMKAAIAEAWRNARGGGEARKKTLKRSR